MLSIEDQLFLIQSRGLPQEAAHFAVCETLRAREAGAETGGSAAFRRRLIQRLEAEGLASRGPIDWPESREIRALAARLHRAGATLAWRGFEPYPERLAARLGGAAPPWVWLAGPSERLGRPACAMVGSRQSAPLLLDAARRLARALAEAGVAVVSGMAAGADTAAHQGAMMGALGGTLAGPAGTIAVPAYGILNTPLGECRSPMRRDLPRMTCLALDRPDAPFSAGLAIRRNSVIAALGDGLVLVASGLKGGSSYAVRWAMEHGQPLWCFEAGPSTPPANRHLIRQGLAQPLPLGERPEQWVERMRPGLAQYGATPPGPEEDLRGPGDEQLSLI